MQFDTRRAEKVDERCSKSSGFMFWTIGANNFHVLVVVRDNSPPRSFAIVAHDDTPIVHVMTCQ